MIYGIYMSLPSDVCRITHENLWIFFDLWLIYEGVDLSRLTLPPTIIEVKERWPEEGAVFHLHDWWRGRNIRFGDVTMFGHLREESEGDLCKWFEFRWLVHVFCHPGDSCHPLLPILRSRLLNCTTNTRVTKVAQLPSTCICKHGWKLPLIIFPRASIGQPKY